MKLWSTVLPLFFSAAVPVPAQQVAAPASTVSGEYLIELSPETTPETFQERLSAASINYKITHTFANPKVFYGVSIKLVGETDSATAHSEIKGRLGSVGGVKYVHNVEKFEVPEPETAGSNPNTALPVANASTVLVDGRSENVFQARQTGGDASGDLSFTLRMGGIEKLHAKGIRGKGVKIGFIDTGVDHSHPALGGFGPGKKIVGGRSFITDDGVETESPDPGASCWEAYHGTHVAGIIGMNPLERPTGWPITGVAPEASLYAYRVFSCQSRDMPGRGGTNVLILKAMEAALSDGVDILSMSLSINDGQIYPGENQPDPLADVAQRLADQGVTVLVAMSNPGGDSAFLRSLYTQTKPSELSTVVGVGSTANDRFPLVFEAWDPSGRQLRYGAVQPFFDDDASRELDVYVVPGNPCWSDSWEDAVKHIVGLGGDLNKTVLAYHVSPYACRPSEIDCCGKGETAKYQPKFLLGIYDPMITPFQNNYESPLNPRFGNGARLGTMTSEDAAALMANYAGAGNEFGKYKIKFSSTKYTSPPQGGGGSPDYFSAYGPKWISFELKPQLTAPGGHILSTYPRSFGGGYGILSGTSMATPYAAGCYALVKSQYPRLPPRELTAVLQATARPQRWAYDTALLAATPQQGAGLINPADAIESLKTSRVWPGQITIGDNSRTEYGRANFTLWNTSPDKTITYRFGHRGAGYCDYLLPYMKMTQDGRLGSASFPKPGIELSPGASAVVEFIISPPAEGVDPSSLPVFGGFVDIEPSVGPNMSIPYVGAPYNRYQATHLLYRQPKTLDDVPMPWFRVDTQSLPNGYDYDRGFLSFDTKTPWSLFVDRLQWTRLWRVDILPANTGLAPKWAPPNLTVPADYVYKPAANPPAAPKLFGKYDSYGTLSITKGLATPLSTVSPAGVGFTVQEGEGGRNVTLSAGDYRVLILVLRWGGDPELESDYESHLSGILRLE